MKQSSIGKRQHDLPAGVNAVLNAETRSMPGGGGPGSARDESRNVSSPFQRPVKQRSRFSPQTGRNQVRTGIAQGRRHASGQI